MCVLRHFSRVGLFMTLWTVAGQAPLSMVLFTKNTGGSSRDLPGLQTPALVSGFLLLAPPGCQNIYSDLLYYQRKKSID